MYTVCDDLTLVTTSLALHRHLQVGEWALALARCSDWQDHARLQAPQWAAQADQLYARVRAVADAAAQGVPAGFSARALEKS